MKIVRDGIGWYIEGDDPVEDQVIPALLEQLQRLMPQDGQRSGSQIEWQQHCYIDVSGKLAYVPSKMYRRRQPAAPGDTTGWSATAEPES